MNVPWTGGTRKQPSPRRCSMAAIRARPYSFSTLVCVWLTNFFFSLSLSRFASVHLLNLFFFDDSSNADEMCKVFFIIIIIISISDKNKENVTLFFFLHRRSRESEYPRTSPLFRKTRSASSCILNTHTQREKRKKALTILKSVCSFDFFFRLFLMEICLKMKEKFTFSERPDVGTFRKPFKKNKKCDFFVKKNEKEKTSIIFFYGVRERQ